MGEKTTLLHLIFAQNRQKCAILPKNLCQLERFAYFCPLVVGNEELRVRSYELQVTSYE